MTDTATEDTFEGGLIEAPPSVPFDDDENPSKAFEVTSPVDVTRLQSEIREALGVDVQVVLQCPGGFEEPISKKNPATVHVAADDDFDGRTVRGVITSHDPDAEPEEGSLEAYLKALASGEDLDLAGVSAVLRMLVGG